MIQKLICLFTILACFVVSKNLIGQCNINFCSDPPILTADTPYFDRESESLIIENVTFGKTGCDEAAFNTGIGLYIYQLLPNGERMFQCTVLNPAPSNYVGSVSLGFGNPDLCNLDAFNYGIINARPENGFVACDGATYEIELALFITEIIDLNREVSIYEQLEDDQYIINNLGTIDVHLTDQFPGGGLPLTTAKIEEFSTGATGTIELTCGDKLELAVEAISRLSNCPPLDDISLGIPSEMTNDFYYSVDGAEPVILQSPDSGATGGQLTGLNGDDVCYAGLLGVRTLEFSELEGVCDGSTVLFTVKTTDTFTGQTEEDQITVRYTGGSCEACAGIPGCTNIDACNYNPEATEEDNSCTFPIENFDCDGNCLVDEDCAGNCGGTAITDCEGLCEGTAITGSACDDGDPTTTGDIYDDACNCTGSSTPGCIDETACNYNELATVDDGSCSFPETNFDCDGNCLVEEDCAGNCGGTATTDCEGVCEGTAITGSACDDGDPTTTGDVYDGACNCVGSSTPGCIDETACNYNELATVDDGSCSFPETNFDCDGNCLVEEDCEGTCGGTVTTDCTGECGGDVRDGAPCGTNGMYDAGCECIEKAELTGCMDATACNYDENATIEGPCYVEDCTGECNGTATVDCENVCEGLTNAGAACDDGDPTTTGDVYDSSCNCAGIATAGCTDIAACNYDELATVNDDSCIYESYYFNCNCDEPCPAGFNQDEDCNCNSQCGPAADAGENAEITICENDAPFDLFDILNGTPEASGQWVYQNKGGPYISSTFTPGVSEDGDYVYFHWQGDECPFSEATVIVTTNPVSATENTATICEGETYTLPDGTEVTTTGSFETMLTSSLGCDSIIVTLLTTLELDCEGVCEGDAVPGSPCDDGDPSTIDDVYNNDCVCQGLNTSTVPGCTDPTACNYDENATIEGPCYTDDCAGECGGTALPGSTCDGDDPTTTDTYAYDSNCVCVATTDVPPSGQPPSPCESIGGTISFSNTNIYGDGSYVCYEAAVTVAAADFTLAPNQTIYYIYHINGIIADLSQLQDIIVIDATFENFDEKAQIYVTAFGATVNTEGEPNFDDSCTVFSNTLTVNLLDPIEIDIQTECDDDNGEFSYAFTVNGGLPGSVPSMSYAITSDYWNGELQAGQAQLVGPISDAENFNITATDPNDCTSSASKTVNCTKLPISLISFTGEASEAGDLLKWLSASEIENDYYTLQYSIDGIAFKTIATVKGAGNKSTPSQYEYLNREPANGIVYYKLWQTDFDQTLTELKTISLNRGETTNQIVDIFPVPVSNQLNIIYHSNSHTTINIKIYNAIGEIVSETNNQAIEGNNFIKFDTKNYTSGMYMVNISSGKSVSISKIIVE